MVEDLFNIVALPAVEMRFGLTHSLGDLGGRGVDVAIRGVSLSVVTAKPCARAKGYLCAYRRPLGIEGLGHEINDARSDAQFVYTVIVRHSPLPSRMHAASLNRSQIENLSGSGSCSGHLPQSCSPSHSHQRRKAWAISMCHLRDRLSTSDAMGGSPRCTAEDIRAMADEAAAQ